jgi:hypothetical protein
MRRTTKLTNLFRVDREAERLFAVEYKNEYARRTAAAVRGIGDPRWIEPGRRMSWSDVVKLMDKFAIPTGDLVAAELWFQGLRSRRRIAAFEQLCNREAER